MAVCLTHLASLPGCRLRDGSGDGMRVLHSLPYGARSTAFRPRPGAGAGAAAAETASAEGLTPQGRSNLQRYLPAGRRGHHGTPSFDRSDPNHDAKVKLLLGNILGVVVEADSGA